MEGPEEGKRQSIKGKEGLSEVFILLTLIRYCNNVFKAELCQSCASARGRRMR